MPVFHQVKFYERSIPPHEGKHKVSLENCTNDEEGHLTLREILLPKINVDSTMGGLGHVMAHSWRDPTG